MGASRRILNTKRKDIVTQLGKRSGSRTASKSRPNNDNRIFSFVIGSNKFQVTFPLIPAAGDITVWTASVQRGVSDGYHFFPLQIQIY